MEINTTQTIIINYEDSGDKSKLIISESLENKDYVEITQCGESIVFPKELVDIVVRSLAKFSH